jgi:hypothetical protein
VLCDVFRCDVVWRGMALRGVATAGCGANCKCCSRADGNLRVADLPALRARAPRNRNKEFRGKKHPYVYALVNNGTKEYDKIKVGDFPEGCHIPFRDATKFMETMARVTFLDGTLSVVMRPLGSMDWVRCFEIKNVKLPNYGFFGVTAMTGELVDHHQMIEMRVYNDVRTDPWTYAVPNDPSQMPDMWHAMLHSGELAREYSQWEQKIIEETEFDPEERADPYNDPYKEEAEEGAAADEAYRQETEEQQQRDKEPEPEEHSGSGDSGSRSNMIREKRAKYEARKRGERGVKVDDPRTSLAELESIEEELAALGPLQNYYERVQNENRDKIAKLRQHMEAEVNEISTRLTTMLRDIRFKEHALTQRIYQLADRLNVDIVRPLEAEHEESKRGWLLPFLVFLSLCGAVALLGYSRYRHFMKTHLL